MRDDPSAPRPAAPPGSILLVDDQPANLLALEAILSDLGPALVRANSGEEALVLLEQGDFAAVLLDVRMPGLSGFETAQRIRQRERSRHTPIIFLTAFEGPDFPVEEAYALGAVDYLVKPLVPVIVRSKVAAFVELYRRTEQVRRQEEQLRELQRRDFERKIVDETQRHSQEYFRLMANAAPALLWVAGPDGQRNYFNTQWLEFTGRTPEQETGDGWTEGVHPEDLPAALGIFRAALEARQPVRTEYRLRKRNGDYRSSSRRLPTTSRWPTRSCG